MDELHHRNRLLRYQKVLQVRKLWFIGKAVCHYVLLYSDYIYIHTHTSMFNQCTTNMSAKNRFKTRFNHDQSIKTALKKYKCG